VNASTCITVLNLTALVAIMLSMGLQVDVRAILVSTRHMLPLVLGLIANYAVIPAVTVGLLFLFQANPLVSVGFLILAVCPGAPLGPPIAAVAKGHVPWAVAMMLFLAGLSAILSPALLSVLLPWTAPESNFHVDYLAIVRTLLITQMLPLASGLGIHHMVPRLTRWIAKPVRIIGNASLFALLVLIVGTQYQSLAAIRFRGWTGMCLLLLASLGIGWLCGGPATTARKSMAVTTATRNAAVALVIVADSFAGTPAVTAVVAYGLISTLGALCAAFLLGKFIALEERISDAE
jgi:BASS family bile acid:Na+ symporter